MRFREENCSWTVMEESLSALSSVSPATVTGSTVGQRLQVTWATRAAWGQGNTVLPSGCEALASGAWLDLGMKQENPVHLMCRPHSLERSVAQISDVYPSPTSKD